MSCSRGRVHPSTKGFVEEGDYIDGVEAPPKKHTGHKAYKQVAGWVDRNRQEIEDFLMGCNRLQSRL